MSEFHDTPKGKLPDGYGPGQMRVPKMDKCPCHGCGKRYHTIRNGKKGRIVISCEDGHQWNSELWVKVFPLGGMEPYYREIKRNG